MVHQIVSPVNWVKLVFSGYCRSNAFLHEDSVCIQIFLSLLAAIKTFVPGSMVSVYPGATRMSPVILISPRQVSSQNIRPCVVRLTIMVGVGVGDGLSAGVGAMMGKGSREVGEDAVEGEEIGGRVDGRVWIGVFEGATVVEEAQPTKAASPRRSLQL